MSLEKITETTFRSKTAAFAPGGNLVRALPTERKRTFGGHVYAQAVLAASKTLEDGFVVHVWGLHGRLQSMSNDLDRA